MTKCLCSTVPTLLVLLVRPVAEHLVTLSHRLPTLRGQAQRLQVGVVLVGDGPYRPVDVAGPLGVDVLGDLPTTPVPQMRSLAEGQG